MLDKVYKVYKHILLTCMCSCICYFLICQCMCADMYTHKYTHACSVYVYTYMLYESILVLWLLFSVYLIYSGWIDVIHWFFYTCKKLKQIFKIQIYELFFIFWKPWNCQFTHFSERNNTFSCASSLGGNFTPNGNSIIRDWHFSGNK